MVRFHELIFTIFLARSLLLVFGRPLLDWPPVCKVHSLSMYVDGLIENARAMWWSKSPSWKAPLKVSFTHLMSTKGAHEKVRLRYLKTSCSG